MAYTYIRHDQTVANRYVYANETIFDTSDNSVIFNKGKLIGVATGDIFKTIDDKQRYEIMTQNKTWYIDINSDLYFGENRAGSYKTSAQSDLSKLIENQKITLDYLNISAAMVADLEYKGRDMSQQRKAIKYYYERLFQRNSDLKDSGVLENIQTGTTQLTEQYGNYLEKIAKDQKPLRIGLAPLVPIIIKAVVVLALAVTAYMIVRAIFVESQTDLKEASTLAESIAKMDPIVGNSYSKYLDSLSKNSWTSVIKWVAIIGGVAFITYKALPQLSKNKK